MKTINIPATQSHRRNLLSPQWVAGPVALAAFLGNLQLESKMVSWVGHIGTGEVLRIFCRRKQKKCEGLLPYSNAPHPTAVAFCPANSSLEATVAGGIHTGEKSERSTW